MSKTVQEQPDSLVATPEPTAHIADSLIQSSSNGHTQNSPVSDTYYVEKLVDVEAMRRDIERLREFRLDQDDEWRETADGISTELSKLRVRWKELEIARKAMNKLLKPTPAVAVKATRGPGRPGRRAKRQKTDS